MSGERRLRDFALPVAALVVALVAWGMRPPAAAAVRTRVRKEVGGQLLAETRGDARKRLTSMLSDLLKGQGATQRVAEQFGVRLARELEARLLPQLEQHRTAFDAELRRTIAVLKERAGVTGPLRDAEGMFLVWWGWRRAKPRHSVLSIGRFFEDETYELEIDGWIDDQPPRGTRPLTIWGDALELGSSQKVCLRHSWGTNPRTYNLVAFSGPVPPAPGASE